MKKPTSLKGLKDVLDDLTRDYSRWRRVNITEKEQEYHRKLCEQHKITINAYETKIKDVKAAIKERKSINLEKKKPFNEKLMKWFKYTYQRGVDFGYNGVSIRYVDPANRYIIVTSNGSTAGTGTAMGTGGYYYAESDHFVAFPQFGDYLEGRLPDKPGRSANKRFEVRGGRLTNEVKNSLIKQANDYCKEYNVKPFEL